jgi:D-alanyl-D-alanine carboxypeptidase (penicillin-binding protein 5/6)
MSTKKHHGRSLLLFMLLILAGAGGYTEYVLSRPLPQLQPVVSAVSLPTATGLPVISWPSVGQSAVAIPGTSILESHGKQTSAPTASVAKVITALAVLQKKPLEIDRPGPSLTLTAADVAIYNSYVAQEGSVVPVSNGEQITEYQMLEALMLPSANNIADSLAIWAFGSLTNYQVYAQHYVTGLGLKSTHIGSDASGYSPSTISSARDLAILGEQAMDSPVLRQIVAKDSATDVPETSRVPNVNFLLGTANIIGIKTGNTDQAGGVFLSASTTQVNNQTVTIVTALMGAPTLFQALQLSLPMITSAQTNFITAKLLSQQSIVGRYDVPWDHSRLSAAAQTDLHAAAWRGSTLTADIKLKPITTTARIGQIVGTISTRQTAFSSPDQINIILEKAPTIPSIWWRLLHPVYH